MEEGESPPYDGSNPKDNLSMYPDLEAARESFVRLFENEKPLRDLGYNPSQIRVAKGPLLLIQDEGEITDYTSDPSLMFEGGGGSWANIIRDQRKGEIVGHHLVASLPINRNALAELFGKDSSPVFERIEKVVDIHSLDRSKVNIASIPELIALLYNEESGWVDGALMEENIITKLGRKVGITATFRAAWVDERNTKLAVEISNPGGEPSHQGMWRLLTDQGQTHVPIGLMPDVNSNIESQVVKALEQKSTVTGTFGLQRI